MRAYNDLSGITEDIGNAIPLSSSSSSPPLHASDVAAIRMAPHRKEAEAGEKVVEQECVLEAEVGEKAVEQECVFEAEPRGFAEQSEGIQYKGESLRYPCSYAL